MTEKERKALNSRNYRKRHPERVQESNKKYKAANKQKISDYNKIYLQENREKVYRLNAAVRARYRRENPQFKIAENLRTRFRQCLKGNKKEECVLDLLGCSLKQFQEYIESLFIDGMAWENYGLWHLDHIKPLRAFNLLDKEERQIAWHYTNFQPLWALDNLKKGSKICQDVQD